MTELGAPPASAGTLLPTVVILLILVGAFAFVLGLRYGQARRRVAPQRPGRVPAIRLPWRPEPSTASLVRPLTLAPGRHPVYEPVLPPQVVAASGWQSVFFHGSVGDRDRRRRLAVRAAAVRGVAHLSGAERGQDVVGAAWNERRGALFLAVADGLSSLPRSGEAARRAVSTTLAQCAELGPGHDFSRRGVPLFTAVARDLKEFTTARNWDGATTLVVAEVRPHTAGAAVTVCGVGDSEAWVLYDGAWRMVHGERDDDRANATRQLPGNPEPYVTKPVRYPVGTVLVLASDGFAAALGSAGTPLSRDLGVRWRTLPTPIEFVAHVDFVEEHFTDDRAAVAVWIR